MGNGCDAEDEIDRDSVDGLSHAVHGQAAGGTYYRIMQRAAARQRQHHFHLQCDLGPCSGTNGAQHDVSHSGHPRHNVFPCHKNNPEGSKQQAVGGTSGQPEPTSQPVARLPLPLAKVQEDVTCWHLSSAAAGRKQ